MSASVPSYRSLQPFVQAGFAASVGLIIGAALMSAWGFNPVTAYSALVQGSLGDIFNVSTTLSSAAPLILTGLTFAVGVRAGLFNIGSEGQVYIGTLGALAVSGLHLPPGLHLLASVLAAMFAGAAWSIPASVLKISRGVHEVISTIMLNWIARWLSLYLASLVLVDFARPEKTITAPPSARFALLIEGTDLSAAIFAGIVFSVAAYGLLWHTVLGYEIRSVGLNPDASRYAGVSQRFTLITAFVVGGLASGLAGATQVLGKPPVYALYGDLSNVVNLGFDGIAVALVGRNHPLGVILAAVFFGALASGARAMQIQAGVALEMVRVVQGAIIMAMAAPEALTLLRRLRPRRID